MVSPVILRALHINALATSRTGGERGGGEEEEVGTLGHNLLGGGWTLAQQHPL